MKCLLFSIILCSMCVLQYGCEKHNQGNTDDTNVPGLPPATQSGANTLGFLLNGQPWIPEGNNGTANLSIDFDPGINNGTIGISARRISTSGNRSGFGIGVIDSLNLLAVPFTRQLSRISIFRAGFSKIDSCTVFSHYDSCWSSGFITVEKFDRLQRIIAGEFEFKLYLLGCDTVRITNGRFDLKF